LVRPDQRAPQLGQLKTDDAAGLPSQEDDKKHNALADAQDLSVVERIHHGGACELAPILRVRSPF
jgi:hypothetical protein